MLADRLRFKSNSGIPTDGLIAWYTMDNITGSTLVDETGTYSGAITGAIQVTGVIGQALGFSNDTDIVACPTDAAFRNAAFTWSLWLKHTAPGNRIVAEINGNSGVSIQTATVHNDGECFFVAGGLNRGYRSAGKRVDDGLWHHIVGVIGGAQDGVYIDNVRYTTAMFNGTPLTPIYATSDFTIAKRPGLSGLTYAGAIDQLRVYNRALGAAEITKLYNEVA